MFFLSFVFAVFVSLFSSTMLANTTQPEDTWASTAHFGFAVQRGRPGLEDTGGSCLFLDIDTPATKSLHLGIRTAALGSLAGEAESYRLFSGPIAKWEAYQDILLELTIGAYSESGRSIGPQSDYSSRGYGVGLSWERRVAISERVSWSWGGFWIMTNGSVSAAQSSIVPSNAGNSNLWGDSKGLKLSLRMEL